MNNLPEDIINYIYKIYYTNEIIPLIKDKKSNLCLLCCLNNFPCINCARYCYNYKYGPGYLYYNKIENTSSFKPRTFQDITFSETFDSFFKDAMDYYQN